MSEGRRPRVDLRRQPEDLLGPIEIEEDVEQPASSSPAPSGDPRVPVVAESLNRLWVDWSQAADDGRPAPLPIEVEAEAVLLGLDDWTREQLAATGTPYAGVAIVAIVAKLSRTQAALTSSVLAHQHGAKVSPAVLGEWERIARGETTPPVSDGLNG